MELHRNEKGQMLVMAAIELLMLLGLLALATDVGVLFHSKRHMQTAADAAATAAALNDYNGGLNVTGYSDATIARNAAAANGYTNGQEGVDVTVNTPPTSGYHEFPGYVEVIVSKPDPLYFFKVFTGNNTTMVAARAVAGDPIGNAGCIYLTAPDGVGLYLQGSALINAPNCGVYVNSNSTDAVDMNNQCGSSGCVNTAFLDTPGGLAKFQTYPTNTSVVTAGSTPPFQNVPYPDPATACSSPGTGNTYGGTSYVAGVNTLPTPTAETITNLAGISTSVDVTCFSQDVSIGSTLTSSTSMGNGLFIFENGVTLNGNVTWGSYDPACTDPETQHCTPGSQYGATIYNYKGTFQQKNGTMTMYSPQSGVFNALALIEPWEVTYPDGTTGNTNQLNLQFGESGKGTDCSLADAALNGYIYAPGANVSLQDSGGGSLVTGIVAATMTIQASTLNVCNYNKVNYATTPLRDIALVE